MREITEKRLRELEDSEAQLRALEAGGVDNWEWYGESMKSYNKEIEEREKIKILYDEIETIICSGVEEPAGHGAGYGVSDTASDEALKALINGIYSIRL